MNECNSTVTDCDQVCVNTNGSYYCDCDNGYTLSEDNKTCQGMVIKSLAKYSQ